MTIRLGGRGDDSKRGGARGAAENFEQDSAPSASSGVEGNPRRPLPPPRPPPPRRRRVLRLDAIARTGASAAARPPARTRVTNPAIASGSHGGHMITMSGPLIDELTREAATTRRVLERVPRTSSRGSRTPNRCRLGQLALHVAQTPGGVAELLSQTESEPPQFKQPEATSSGELLSALDQSIATARSKLGSWSDADLMAEWTMKRGGKTVMAVPRIGMVRQSCSNRWYHHRGQLLVYLRLLDVPVPSVYRPERRRESIRVRCWRFRCWSGSAR